MVFLIFLVSLDIQVLEQIIIQYNIDQLLGASANELSSYIHWHIASIPFVCIATEIVRCTIKLE